jgi:hypothetical protein
MFFIQHFVFTCFIPLLDVLGHPAQGWRWKALLVNDHTPLPFRPYPSTRQALPPSRCAVLGPCVACQLVLLPPHGCMNGGGGVQTIPLVSARFNEWLCKRGMNIQFRPSFNISFHHVQYSSYIKYIT